MMGKMAVGLLGLMGKGLLGGGTRRAGTALSILGKGSGCMRSGGQGAAVEEAAETLLRWKRRLLPCWSEMSTRQRRVFRLLPDLNLKRLLLMLTS